MALDLQKISTFYFVGIGGIGMSAIARYFRMQNKKVYGYDRVPSALTRVLEEEGMDIVYEDHVNLIPDDILENEDVLIVYTPAVGAHNDILNYFLSREFVVLKRAVLLGEISRDTVCLAVAGTHGKTTTSAILAHLMVAADMPVVAFLGGIAENYNSNFIYQGDKFCVVEADEYDRSFLRLQPDIACVTSMEADHLDIYGDALAVEEAFKNFAALVDDEQKVFLKQGLPLAGMTVAVEDSADFSVRNIRINKGFYLFDLVTPETVISDLVFHLPGHHNLANAAMAMGMAITAGADIEKLRRALESFQGVDRRFSYKIKTDNLVLIDDYAHHPTELDALFQAVNEMYPDDRKQIVFQPHLYSRTKDFGAEFAKSLSKFDEVVLLDIYPAREEPLEGINSQWLLEKISAPIKMLISKENIVNTLKSSSSRIKLLVGAGDIGAEVKEITKKLKE